MSSIKSTGTMVSSFSYEQAVAWLDQRQWFTIKLGLETTRALLAELGNPQEKLAIVHIAGTNGKGSVGATLMAILAASGRRAGFYSSPHLHSVRERFRLNGTCISKMDFARLISRLVDLLGSRPLPTYFECTTLLALLWFAEQNADIVILETGMGGRLDATNVVTPLVSVITDIGLDHQQHLGDTLEAIAREKAGIVKSGVPVVASGRAPASVPVFETRCRQTASPFYLYNRDFFGSSKGAHTFIYQGMLGSPPLELPLPLPGDHQVVNASLALATLEILSSRFPCTPQCLASGCGLVRWPGRMETITHPEWPHSARLLLDGAHNEDGVAVLLPVLHRELAGHKLFLLWGNMGDKCWGKNRLALFSLATLVMLTQVESHRSASTEMLLASLPEEMQKKCRCAETPAQAIEALLRIASPEDLVCIAGSLYLVGAIRQLLLGEVI